MSYLKSAKTNEIIFGKSPDILQTSGIGSCVVITFWDSRALIGALAHISSPKNTTDPLGVEPSKTIPFILAKLLRLGANKSTLRISLIGGGNMFKSVLPIDYFNIGPQIVNQIKAILQKYDLFVTREDTGGALGKNVHFELQTGILTVKDTSGSRRNIK